MKTIIGTFITLLSIMLGAAQINVTLEWDAPPGFSEGVYKLYRTTNPAAPVGQWLVLTNVAAPSCRATIAMTPGAYFFTCTASNFWGESTNSNIVATPAPATNNPNSLRIYR